MSRQIRFRGKRIDNGEWVYGWYTENLKEEAAIVVKYDFIEHTEIPVNKWQQCVPVDPNTVGQFTGLQDKNGVDVYEGDYLNRDGAYVVWSHQLACWCFAFVGEGEILTPIFNERNTLLEVTGNIHDKE